MEKDGRPTDFGDASYENASGWEGKDWGSGYFD
jgi:hypothetical protein